MSKEPIVTNTCKQRFKGVENFLRKVAFNLGNSPSQTEVKIISCIPIDVTDLQQKIINLEKQLDEAKAGKATPAPTHEPQVHAVTVPRTPPFPAPSKPVHTSPPPERSERCEACTLSGSRTDCLPPEPRAQPCNCWSDMSQPLELIDPYEVPDYRKCLFKKCSKKKKPCRNKDNKTQFVYFAQTTANPFPKKHTGSKAPKQTVTGGIDRDYVSKMIKKQYVAFPIAKEYSITSQFSSPVCRDVETDAGAGQLDEADMCSCCRGAFHNIDHVSGNRANLEPIPTYLNRNAGFYDSSMYDMVPVKEKPVKTPDSYYEPSKRKLPKSDVISPYHSERTRPKIRYNPFIVNYSRIPATYNIANTGLTKLPPKKNRVRWLSPQREVMFMKTQKLYHDPESSKSCSIDCGDVYLKHGPTGGKPQSLPVLETKPRVSYKNAECLTISMNDSTCQTTTTTSVQMDSEFDEKKTEETLNQIKSILQSVLTEVKTNAQKKDAKCKDAVVQKGPSQGHMPGGSTMMGSFTYSPYNMNPYLPSCSRQMNTNLCCYSNAAYAMNKCMQNFPVFIQTPGRPLCTSCVRNSHVMKPAMPKPTHPETGNKISDYTAAVANIKKETDEKQKKETKTLIKEIYKSMAVNMAAPSKETSASECEGLKAARQVSTNKSLYRPNEGVKIFMKPSISRNAQKWSPPVSALNSKLNSDTVSLRSQVITSTSNTDRCLKNRIETFLRNSATPQIMRNESGSPQKERLEDTRQYDEGHEDTSSASEEEEEEFTETESDESVIVPHQNIIKQTEKKGLFSKIFKKSANLFTAKNKKSRDRTPVQNHIKEEQSEDEDTDSDATVCSRSPRPAAYAPRPHARPPRPSTGAPRHAPSRLRSCPRPLHRLPANRSKHRREPYMEQEFRRQWNEKLMFRENQQRLSSGSPYTREADPRLRPHAPPPHHPYWQHYEARPALVGPSPGPTTLAPPRPTPRQLKRKSGPKLNVATKGLSWLKRHKMGIHCGEQWKNFILEG